MHFSLLQLQEPDTEMCQKVETFTLLMSSQPFFLWNNIKWLLKADVGPLVLQQQPDKKGESDLVTDVNTVEQLLWNPPHNPGCLFQPSPCSPMHIFVTTRDTEQGSYSNFFFLFNVLSTSLCIHELDVKNSLTSDRNYTKIFQCLMRCLNAALTSELKSTCWLCCTELYSPNWCTKSNSKPLRLAGQSHGVSSYSLCHSKSLPRKVSLITEFLHLVLFIIIVLLCPKHVGQLWIKKKTPQKITHTKKTQNWGAASGKNYTKGSALWVSFATSIKYA